MQKRALKIVCRFLIVLFGSMVLLVFIWLFSGVISENYEAYEVEIGARLPFRQESLSALCDAIEATLPDYCKGRQLVEVRAEIRSTEDPPAAWDTVSFFYYRYLNDFREGGNIELNQVVVDNRAGKILRVEIFKGAGKASPSQASDQLLDRGQLFFTPEEALLQVKENGEERAFDNFDDIYMEVEFDHKGRIIRLFDCVANKILLEVPAC